MNGQQHGTVDIIEAQLRLLRVRNEGHEFDPSELEAVQDLDSFCTEVSTVMQAYATSIPALLPHIKRIITRLIELVNAYIEYLRTKRQIESGLVGHAQYHNMLSQAPFEDQVQDMIGVARSRLRALGQSKRQTTTQE